jgi:WD40 repeat protein
MVRFSSQ